LSGGDGGEAVGREIASRGGAEDAGQDGVPDSVNLKIRDERERKLKGEQNKTQQVHIRLWYTHIHIT
jgi:hypothetical protein